MDIEELRKEIPGYEKELPLPYAFKKLISIFRRLGKHSKKQGDNTEALAYFNKMLSLSILWHKSFGAKKSGIEGREVDRAKRSLRQVKTKYGTLYPFTFQDNGPVGNDVLLSATDYKNLTALNDVVHQIPSKNEEAKTRKKSNTKRQARKSQRTRASNENGIKINWLDGKKLSSSGRKAVYEGKNGKNLSIEFYALEYYSSLGYSGYWSENEYWWAIMSLLFWDVIFSQLPGVFTPAFGSFPSKMQDMPRDFFSPDFYPKRKRLITKRISELTKPRFFGLQQPNIEAELKASFRKYKGKPCRSMIWEKYTKVGELLLAPRLLSNAQLTKITDRLLINFGENRKGLPDLFMGKDGIPVFVEVKSEREKVADHQIEWLKYIKNKAGVHVEICRVVNSAK